MSETELPPLPLTKESVDRLYVVNDIRDRLNEHSSQLSEVGFLKILGFGSAITGNANDKSDIDLAALVKKGGMSGPNFRELQESRQTLLKEALQDLPIEVAFNAPPQVDDTKVVHVTVDSIGDIENKPFYAQDSIELWRSPLETPNKQ
jgi:predicted nucleotidyltransferase